MIKTLRHTVRKTTATVKKKDSLLMILAACFLLGVLIGAAMLSTADQTATENLSFLFQGFIQNRGSAGFFSSFFSSFSSALLILLISFLSGFSAISTPFIFLIAVYRGLGIGMTAGYLYSNNGLAGIGFFAGVVAPGAVAISLTLIYACKESIRFSMIFLRPLYRPFPGTSALPALKIYLRRYLMFFFILAGASLCDVLVSSMFLWVFGL